MNEKLDLSQSPSSEYRYFVYDPLGDGMVFFRSKPERDRYAEDAITMYLDDTWMEEVEQVVTGEVTRSAQCLNKKKPPDNLDEDGLDEDGNYWDPDWEWAGNYTLEPLPEAEGQGGAGGA